MSRPRRPRLRFSESEESATCCSSRSTNCGATSVPSRKPVSQMSAMRPSMITEVSRILYWWSREESLKAAMMRAGSSHSPLRAPDHDTHVAEEHHQQHVHEVLAHDVEPGQRAPDQARGEQAGDAPDQRAHQVVAGDATELPSSAKSARPSSDAEDGARPGRPPTGE